MTMSPADIEAFISELQRDPQLRDRVRNAILADDFLALPGIVARLGVVPTRVVYTGLDRSSRRRRGSG